MDRGSIDRVGTASGKFFLVKSMGRSDSAAGRCACIISILHRGQRCISSDMESFVLKA